MLINKIKEIIRKSNLNILKKINFSPYNENVCEVEINQDFSTALEILLKRNGLIFININNF